MPVYLIRHGHAGSRWQWDGEDDDRPLTDKGRRQADALVAYLGDGTVGRVMSSPSLRCVQTVEPIADHHRTHVELRRELYEGADPDRAVELILEAAPSDPVLASHGDVIPQVVRRLAARGMRTLDPAIAQKGSLWVVEVRDGVPVSGSYRPPS